MRFLKVATLPQDPKSRISKLTTLLRAAYQPHALCIVYRAKEMQRGITNSCFQQRRNKDKILYHKMGRMEYTGYSNTRRKSHYELGCRGHKANYARDMGLLLCQGWWHRRVEQCPTHLFDSFCSNTWMVDLVLWWENHLHLISGGISRRYLLIYKRVARGSRPVSVNSRLKMDDTMGIPWE